MEVYIVSYWSYGRPPVVTAFDDEDAANRCYECFSAWHDGCSIDKVPVYSHFSENGEFSE